MNVHLSKSFIAVLISLSLVSCSQSSKPNNVWTIVSIDKNEAYLYKGELKEKELAEKINLWDSIRIDKLKKEINLSNQHNDSTILILKPTEEGGFDGMNYLRQTAEKLGLEEQFGFVKLDTKEKNWFGLHDYDF